MFEGSPFDHGDELELRCFTIDKANVFKAAHQVLFKMEKVKGSKPIPRQEAIK